MPATFENHRIMNCDLQMQHSPIDDDPNSPSEIDETAFSMLSNQMGGNMQEQYGENQEQSECEMDMELPKMNTSNIRQENMIWIMNKTSEAQGNFKVSTSPPTFTITKSPSPPTAITTTSIAASLSPKPIRTFKIGDLVWGAVRGAVAWPGKIVNGPDGEPTSSDCVWVKWYGERRQHTEMVLTNKLQSLSEGLEAHHAAQKDSRK